MGSISCSRNSSFAFFLIFFVFFVIAFATPYWTELGDRNYGIWQTCGGIFDDSCYPIGDVDNGKFNATRAMMCISLICQTVSFVMYCVWVSKDERYLREHGAGPAGISALSLALIGGFFNLMAVCIYGSDYDTSHLEWSYGFACTTTSVLLLNSTITLCVTTCCHDESATPPPATTATMTVITTTQQQPAAVYYPPQQQPMGVYQPPQGGGAFYAAPPPAGYPAQPQPAYPGQQYYQQQQPVMHPQQQLPPYSPQYTQQHPVASAPPVLK